MEQLTETAAEFDIWIANNYAIIKERLILSGSYDDDTFHDSYLTVFEGLKPEMSINHYSRLFIKTYRQLRKKKLAQSFRTVNLSEIFFQLISDDAQTKEQTSSEPKPTVSQKDIIFYANSSLNANDYKLFSMRFLMDMTLQQVGDYLGRSICFVSKNTDRIRRHIRTHFNSFNNHLTARTI